MLEAYRYADGDGEIPDDLLVLRFLDRFGAEAVFHRPPSAGELRRMAAAESIVKTYNERAGAKSWAAWAKDHPEHAEMLNTLARLSNGE